MNDEKDEAIKKCQNVLWVNQTTRTEVWLEDPVFREGLEEASALLHQHQLPQSLSTEAFMRLVELLADVKMCVRSSVSRTAYEVEHTLYQELLQVFTV